MVYRIMLIITIILNAHLILNAQDNVYYFFSNLDQNINKELLQTFTNDISNSRSDNTIVVLGDSDIESIKALKGIDKKAKVRFLTGNEDQNDIHKFNKLDDKKGFKYITTGAYCPDPMVYEINETNLIISLNSNWFLEREIRFNAKDKNCNTFNRVAFFEELEGIIEDHPDKNIFILAHHNTVSNTQLGGKKLWKYDLLPIIGNMYASYRRNIGKEQDLVADDYHYYVNRMNALIKYPNINIIAGHDHVNMVYKNGAFRSMNVNSSSEGYSAKEGDDNTIYQNEMPSYFKLSVNPTDAILEIVNKEEKTEYRIQPKINNLDKKKTNDIAPVSLKNAVQASEKYSSGKFTTWLMGSGYRKAWSTPVSAPALQLTEQHLTPYARGGGLQTLSVKFQSEEKHKYAFRSLDKAPEKSLSDELRKSAYKNIVQELITTMHPYGPLVAYQLIKETDIIHIKPELYIMAPSQEGMGDYADFNNKIGTLEEKPKGKSKKREGYMGADEVVTSFSMLNDLHKSPKNKIDKLAYAKARVFDMYIGDWDRHEDNWKWAKFKTDEGNIFRPIPKDRDHVFSKWTGLIPSVAEKVVPNAENFGDKFGNLWQLNFKAYHLDRQLGTELSAEDWQEAVDYINEKITNEVIDKSMDAFPVEIKDLYSDEINSKLKSRKKDLSRGVHEHYKHLAKDVDVVGTNKRDLFEITRNNDGSVKVIVHSINKKGDKKSIHYQRVFSREDTKTIYCYGLNDKDIFNIDGQVDHSIKIRIIGGDDKDIINDLSSVKGSAKKTQVYDSHDEDDINGQYNELIIKKPSREAHFDPYANNPNGLLPLLSVRNSSGNGLGIGANITSTIQGYNKPGYAKIYKFNALFYPGIGAYRLDGSFKYRHLLGLSDFVTKFTLSDNYDKFPFYYGTGNEASFDSEGRDDGLYRVDFTYSRYDIGLTRTFYEKSKFDNTLFVEYDGVEAENGSGIDQNTLPPNTFFYGYRSHLAFDFTDRSNYPTDGNKMTINLETRLSDDQKITSNFQSEISYYKSLRTGITTTFAGKIGYLASFGEANFYHLSSIGSNVGLRGYSRNRFLDKYAMYYNTELRFDFGSIDTPLIQMHLGTFLMYDGGKVWNDNSNFSNLDWNNSYGIGFFIAPYSTEYAFSYSISKSDDKGLYSRLQFGFNF